MATEVSDGVGGGATELITIHGTEQSFAGAHSDDRGLWRDRVLDEGRHAGGERDPDVDFGEAEVAAVGPRDAPVVCHSQHGTGAEHVTGHGRDGGLGEGEDAGVAFRDAHQRRGCRDNLVEFVATPSRPGGSTPR